MCGFIQVFQVSQLVFLLPGLCFPLTGVVDNGLGALAL